MYDIWINPTTPGTQINPGVVSSDCMMVVVWVFCCLVTGGAHGIYLVYCRRTEY